jgi:hypothetical protein
MRKREFHLPSSGPIATLSGVSPSIPVPLLQATSVVAANKRFETVALSGMKQRCGLDRWILRRGIVSAQSDLVQYSVGGR